MTVAHLLFSIATTAYILLAIQFEERDLVREFGDTYEDYRRSVPMLVPSFRKRSPGTAEASPHTFPSKSRIDRSLKLHEVHWSGQ